jgi:hypothetical protein
MVFACRIGNRPTGRRDMAGEFDQTPSVEEILNDLYRSEINASISLVTPRGGFYAELGNPMQAEAWGCTSIREAVEWLRDHAIKHYPDSEFARHYGRGFVR